MSYSDEVRYGRACLLLLNVCPFTLRHVINEYYTRHGSTNLQDFLEKNKHDIYHIMNKICCCRLIQSRLTPMTRSQWDLLFIKNSSSCQTGFTGDCPCQYDAKPGITSDVMDITFCCLFIKNICSQDAGISMLHIDIIHTIRNHIMHAESAQLDVHNGYWNQVKTALLDLANHVSFTVRTDTLSMIQELETRVMNAGELGEIRKVIVHLKRIEVVKENVSEMKKDLDKTSKTIICVEGNMSQLEGNVSQLDGNVNKLDGNVSQLEGNLSQLEGNMSPRFQHREGEEPDVSRLKEMLIKINHEKTERTTSPLQRRGTQLSTELLFSQVFIREDKNMKDKYDDDTDKYRYSLDTDKYRYSLDTEIAGMLLRSRAPHGKRDLSKNEREVLNPHDIFKLDNEESYTIYMLGDEADGKTTYCVWLLNKWCNAQWQGRNLDVWETALKEFDFVFLLQFCHVSPNRACVIDMVCKDVSRELKSYHAAIRHALSSNKYRSLIIMDGLDEWNPNEETRKQLICQGMPNLAKLSKMVTCFISMRPWVFPPLSKLLQNNDKVIEILGLSETGMEKLVENVLVNRYKLKVISSKYNDVYKRIKMNPDQNTLESLMKIPLLAVVCVQIWYEGKQVGDSMTSFFIAMVNMFIDRAHDKHKLQFQDDKTFRWNLPEILSVHENITNYVSVLLKLGKVAYEGLISNETNLVLQKRKLQKEIGEKELQFALDAGLITQKEAPSLVTKNVSVHFFHKFIQEFLAAIYIVTNKEVGDSFCEHLSNVQVTMGLSNVIMFICGICPSMGSDISQRVVRMTDNDTEICKYRESPYYADKETVRKLYKLQVSWYRELKYGQADNQMTGRPVTLHVSDVYLFNSDTETVRMTSRLLSDHRVDIRSLSLDKVPTDRESGVTNAVLNDFLCNKYNNTGSIVMVNINGGGTDRSIQSICTPSLRCLNLYNVKIKNTHLDGNVCPPLLTHMPSLRLLRLISVTLDDRGLVLFGNMVHVENVRLWHVNMSASQWKQFIKSVLNIQHRFNVELEITNIDNGSMSEIMTSPDFNVTRNGKNKFGWYQFYFIRVWRSSHGSDDDDDNEILYTRL